MIERKVRVQRSRVCPAVLLPPSQYHDAVIARVLGTDGRSSGSRALLKQPMALACRDRSQPNSKQAPNVRGLIKTAEREFVLTLPGRPLESETVAIDQTETVRQLRRELEDLHAERSASRPATPARTPR